MDPYSAAVYVRMQLATRLQHAMLLLRPSLISMIYLDR